MLLFPRIALSVNGELVWAFGWPCCNNTAHPFWIYLLLQSREISFAENIHSSWRIILIFVQSTTVRMSCSVLNFRSIRQSSCILWKNEVLRNLILWPIQYIIICLDTVASCAISLRRVKLVPCKCPRSARAAKAIGRPRLISARRCISVCKCHIKWPTNRLFIL